MIARSFVATLALAATPLLTPPLAAQQVVTLPAGDRPLDPVFAEVLRIGAIDGEPWEIFSTLVAIEFDAQGNLYLFDGVIRAGSPARLLEQLRVLVFSATGTFRHEFGRMGDGPGEFGWPNGYTVMRDGTTVVNDVRHGGYQLFDPSGTYIRIVREPDEVGMTAEIHADPRGAAVLGETSTMNMGRGTGWATRPVLRLSLEGEVVLADTAAVGWLPDRSAPAEFDEFEVASVVVRRLPAALR